MFRLLASTNCINVDTEGDTLLTHVLEMKEVLKLKLILKRTYINNALSHVTSMLYVSTICRLLSGFGVNIKSNT